MPGMNLLQLDPPDTLHFCKSPTTTSPTRMLKITNASGGYVAFKVKTTAPKAYLVRPSSGSLRPKESTDVQIILQPQGMDGSASAHRFLVQAVAVPGPDPVSREDWGNFPKESLQEQRLNVTLEEREDKPAKAADAGFSAAAAAGASTKEGAADLKVKYDELVQYTLTLEKEKKKLEIDYANLQSQKPSTGSDGISKLTLILAMLVVFLGVFLPQKFLS